MEKSKFSISKILKSIGVVILSIVFGVPILLWVAFQLLFPAPNLCLPNILNFSNTNSYISEGLELIGHFGGSVESVFTNNSYAYVGVGSELAILDISNPSSPQRIGYYVLPDKARDIFVDGNYAYVATGESGLRIIDISNSSNPFEVGYYTAPVSINKVSVSNGYVYLPLSECKSYGTFLPTRCSGALQIIDATDPSNPSRLVCNKMSGTPASISIDGDYAYISESTRLLEMNISNPRFARITKTHNVDFRGRAVINNDYLYVSARYDKFRIVDISNPIIFNETGLYDARNPSGTRNAVFDAVVDEKYAYLIVEDVGLEVIDISDPYQPILISSYILEGEIKDISLINSHVYIATENNGLQVIDMTNPSNPVLTGVYESPKSVTKLEVINNLIFAAAEDNGFRIIDASNPKMPYQIGNYQLPDEVMKLADDYDPVYITGVALDGNQAYLAVKDLGVQVVEISNPSYINGTAFYRLENGINDIAIDNNFAYISTELNGIETSNSLPDLSSRVDWHNMPYSFVDAAVGDKYTYLLSNKGLLTVDFPEPNVFNQISFNRINANNIRDLEVSNEYAYVASSSGLSIIHLTSTGIPDDGIYSELKGINLESIAIEGNFVYASGSKGLRIIDVSNPIQPIIVGFYETEKWAYDLAKHGNYIYLFVKDEGLSIIDISNLSEPTKVGFYTLTSGFIRAITSIDSYVYIASGNGGLRILDVANPVIPIEIGYLDEIGYVQDINIKNNFAYIALREGLAIVNITNPSQPLLVKQYKLPTTPWRQKITLADDFAYLPSHSDGLWIVNIANPIEPDRIYYYQNTYDILGIDIQEGYAYFATGNGLRIVNITDSRTSAEVGSYIEPFEKFYDIAVNNNLAYLTNRASYGADIKNDLIVVDISNPKNPLKIATYDLPYTTYGVAVTDEYIYVAAGTDGIFIYRIKE